MSGHTHYLMCACAGFCQPSCATLAQPMNGAAFREAVTTECLGGTWCAASGVQIRQMLCRAGINRVPQLRCDRNERILSSGYNETAPLMRRAGGYLPPLAGAAAPERRTLRTD